MRWLVVLAPAIVGVVSFVVSPDEDLRSSGLMAGVALSIVFAGVLLATRRPWRARSGLAAVAARGGVALVLVVGLAGLLGGAPELLRERFGLLLSTDDRGLLVVAPLDGGFVAVGHPETGAAWTSPDGVTWTDVRLPSSIDGLELRALAPAAGTLWAVAQDETAAGQLVEVAGLDLDWVAGSQFAHEEFGQQPVAAAGFGDELLTVGSIYGNDVVFFRGDPRETLEPSSLEPVFDRGHSASDMACAAGGCVAVGSHWDPAASFWHTSDGDDWELVHLDESVTTAAGVVPTLDGWLAVGNDLDGNAVAWRSADGRAWERDLAPQVPQAALDGIVDSGVGLIAYGRDTVSDQPALWTVDDDNWRRVMLAGPAGSRIRGVAANGETIVAVGVRGDSLQSAAWVSASGTDFRPISLGSPEP